MSHSEIITEALKWIEISTHGKFRHQFQWRTRIRYPSPPIIFDSNRPLNGRPARFEGKMIGCEVTTFA
jgi:hypothetical protein